jgi:uncharacterized damage-inducible protein DinB
MYRKMEDFHNSFKGMVDGTTKIFGALTDENIKQTVTEGHRSLGAMAWHMVTTVAEMMNQTGLGLSAINHESMPPETAAEIVAGYKAVTDELSAKLAAQWTDETLEKTDELYGETWSRGTTLAILMHHEIHHRGQMTILLRQAGSTVPGIYGPAKEEWEKYGMDLPAY